MIKELLVCSLCFCGIVVVDGKMVEVRVDAEVRLSQTLFSLHLVANGYRLHASKSIWIPTLCAQTTSSSKPYA